MTDGQILTKVQNLINGHTPFHEETEGLRSVRLARFISFLIALRMDDREGWSKSRRDCVCVSKTHRGLIVQKGSGLGTGRKKKAGT